MNKIWVVLVDYDIKVYFNTEDEAKGYAVQEHISQNNIVSSSTYKYALIDMRSSEREMKPIGIFSRQYDAHYHKDKYCNNPSFHYSVCVYVLVNNKYYLAV